MAFSTKDARKAGKIDRMSFRIAFNENAIQPDKKYSILIEVKKPGYVPPGVKTEPPLSGKPQTVLLATATGAEIEKLEDDPNVMRVQAPLPKQMKLG